MARIVVESQIDSTFVCMACEAYVIHPQPRLLYYVPSKLVAAPPPRADPEGKLLGILRGLTPFVPTYDVRCPASNVRARYE